MEGRLGEGGDWGEGATGQGWRWRAVDAADLNPRRLCHSRLPQFPPLATTSPARDRRHRSQPLLPPPPLTLPLATAAASATRVHPCSSHRRRGRGSGRERAAQHSHVIGRGIRGRGREGPRGICMWLTLTNSSSNKFKSFAISVLLYSSCKLIELIIINKFIKLSSCYLEIIRNVILYQSVIYQMLIRFHLYVLEILQQKLNMKLLKPQFLLPKCL